MSLFTRVVLLLLLFILPLFLALFVGHMKFGLSRQTLKIFWDAYLRFAQFLITAYSVTWVGQMGKAFLSKREEEKNKLHRELANISSINIDEENEEDIINEEDIEEI